MSFKTTYVLFAVLVCLLAVFGLTQLLGKKPGLETYILPAMHNPEVKVDEITGVTITRSRPKEEKTLNEFRPKYLVAESSFDIQSVKLQEPKHELVAIDKSSEGKWRFEKPPFGEADYEGETAPGPAGTNTNITGVRDLLQAVADIRV